jgi:hypothetical protein
VTQSLDNATLKRVARSANFLDLVGEMWRLMQKGQSPTLPMTVLADSLMDARHVDAACAIFGMLEHGRGSLEITQLDAFPLAPREGESEQGRQLTVSIRLLPPRNNDVDNSPDLPEETFPIRKRRD